MDKKMAGRVAGESRRRRGSLGDHILRFIVLTVAASSVAAIVLEFARSHVGVFAAEAIVEIVQRNDGKNAIPEVARYIDSFSRRSSVLMLSLLGMNGCAAICLLILLGQKMPKEGPDGAIHDPGGGQAGSA